MGCDEVDSNKIEKVEVRGTLILRLSTGAKSKAHVSCTEGREVDSHNQVVPHVGTRLLFLIELLLASHRRLQVGPNIRADLAWIVPRLVWFAHFIRLDLLQIAQKLDIRFDNLTTTVEAHEDGP